MEPSGFDGAPGARIIAPMTPVQTRANGLVIPPLPQLWLTAVLRMLVELVRNVALLFMTNKQHPARDWHTDDDVAPIMMMTNDIIIRKPDPVAASDTSPIALMVSSAAKAARPSNHERVLAGIRHQPSGSGPLVRVPREGGDPVLLNRNARAALKPYSSKPEQASQPALDPRLRGGHGREIAPTPAPA